MHTYTYIYIYIYIYIYWAGGRGASRPATVLADLPVRVPPLERGEHPTAEARGRDRLL